MPTQGRPKLEIDPDTVEKLAAIHCSMAEIASVVECSVDTLQRRFADVVQRGRNKGKTSLKRWQWKAAEKGNVTMLIWLGKQHLDQSDQRIGESHDMNANDPVTTPDGWYKRLKARGETKSPQQKANGKDHDPAPDAPAAAQPQ